MAGTAPPPAVDTSDAALHARARMLETSEQAVNKEAPEMSILHRKIRPMAQAFAIFASVLLTTTGCASRRPAEPAPPAPRPLALLAVLPTATVASNEGSGFGGTRREAMYRSDQGNRISRADSTAAFGAALLIGAVAYGINESRRAEHEALNDALSQVNFEPAAHIDAQLARELEQRNVKLVRITNTRTAAEIRDGKLHNVPQGVDAILDVSILESGYYSSLRAGGYSPMLHLSIRLRAPEHDADDLDSFSYYADWRDGGKDIRWVTTPKDLTFQSIEKLRDNAAEARAGLGRVVEQFAGMIARDVERYAKGLPPLD